MLEERVFHGLRRMAVEQHLGEFRDPGILDLPFEADLLAAAHEVNVIPPEESLVAVLDHLEKVGELVEEVMIQEGLGDVRGYDIKLGGARVLDDLAVPAEPRDQEV